MTASFHDLLVLKM